MSGLMREHPINTVHKGNTFYIHEGDKTYAVPENILEKYLLPSKVEETSDPAIDVSDLFEDLESQYTKAGLLLKGVRVREGMSQKAFAQMLEIPQSNLSAMETGRRAIGKIIAKRIEKMFQVNYRYFLE